MAMVKAKKILFMIGGVIMICAVAYLSYGTIEYGKWLQTKQAIAEGGFAWTCGVPEIVSRQPGCTQSCSGKCCCAACDPLCDGSTYVIFKPQPVCKINFACISPTVPVKGGSIMTTKQAILAGTSNMLSGPTSVVATQSLAANRVEKLAIWVDKYIIASFKDSPK